jgi:hypothetical protein
LNKARNYGFQPKTRHFHLPLLKIEAAGASRATPPKENLDPFTTRL